MDMMLEMIVNTALILDPLSAAIEPSHDCDILYLSLPLAYLYDQAVDVVVAF